MSLPNASVVSSGLTGFPSVYYWKKAIENLKANLFMYPAIDTRPMPFNAGTVMEIHSYQTLAANTTPATEGTPGAGIALTQGKKQISLSQFVDAISYSDKVVMTNIDDTVTAGSQELAYRGALTVDTVISNLVDTICAANPSISIDITAANTYFTASLSRQAGAKIRALNAKPKDNGRFFGVMPSLLQYDLKSDQSVAGFTDLQKFTQPGATKLLEGVDGKGYIGTIDGVDWYESNALTFDADWNSTTANAYHAYVFGKDAIIGASLGQTALGQLNFRVDTTRFNQASPMDLARQVAAGSAYNFFFNATSTPDGSLRFRRIRVPSSIG